MKGEKMKNRLQNYMPSQKGQFDLMDWMSDILENFCKNNNLEFASADEIGWETDEQREWLKRFIRIWEDLSDRDTLRWQRKKYMENPTPWSEYTKDLKIPETWVDVSYSNDTLPSYGSECGEFRIWINAPTLAERQVNYFDIGFKTLEQFTDWRFCVQRMDPYYEESVSFDHYFKDLEDVKKFVVHNKQYLKTHLLKKGDRVQFGDDTWSICGRDEFDISGLKGTVVQFAEDPHLSVHEYAFRGHPHDTEVWIKLDDDSPKHILDAYDGEEWDRSIQFMLTDCNNGGTDFAQLKKAKLLKERS